MVSGMVSWGPDVLGPSFSASSFAVAGRGEHTSATLVRYEPGRGPAPRGTVLYVHGWSDYFANPELARTVTAAGFRFYALDLHGYGRNLTDEVLASGHIPGLATDLREYWPDFQAAREVMMADGAAVDPRHLVVLAHSTGSLTMSLLLMEHPGQVAGLGLATPWIAPHGFPWIDRLVLAAAGLLPERFHDRRLPVRANTHYHRTLSSTRDGVWEVDPRWRPERSFPITPSLLTSTAQARERLLDLHADGRDVGAPVLVQTSKRSLLLPWWDERKHARDSVLDVKAIRRRSTVLHPAPKVISYDGAIHDVHRSATPIREQAFRDLQQWLGELDLG